jgi:hypothetical protein
MQHAILEMSSPDHIMVLDEFNYFYLPSPSKAKFIEVYYSMNKAKSLPPYHKL